MTELELYNLFVDCLWNVQGLRQEHKALAAAMYYPNVYIAVDIRCGKVFVLMTAKSMGIGEFNYDGYNKVIRVIYYTGSLIVPTADRTAVNGK